MLRATGNRGAAEWSPSQLTPGKCRRRPLNAQRRARGHGERRGAAHGLRLFVICFSLQSAGVFILAGAVRRPGYRRFAIFRCGTSYSDAAWRDHGCPRSSQISFAPRRSPALTCFRGLRSEPLPRIARLPTVIGFGALGAVALLLARKAAPKSAIPAGNHTVSRATFAVAFAARSWFYTSDN